MIAKGYIFPGKRGSGIEGETNILTISNKNTERDHCPLMKSYRNKVALWRSVASSQIHTCIWNTTNVSTFATESAETSVRLAAHACKHGAVN
jgi:hypothetical protein